MRYLPFFIVISSCGLSTEHKHKVHYWDVDYYTDESTILVDTSYNSDSQHKLHKIYLAESLFSNWWKDLAQHGKIENDTLEIKILNKGSVQVNGKYELVYKILSYEKLDGPFELIHVYSPSYGIILYTHPHTSYYFYHKRILTLNDNVITDSIVLNYSKEEISEFYFSNIEPPIFDPNEEPEISDTIEIVLDLD